MVDLIDHWQHHALGAPIWGFTLGLGLMAWLHCLVGLVAARVAYNRGRDLALWLPWGLLAGTIALVMAYRGDRLPGEFS